MICLQQEDGTLHAELSIPFSFCSSIYMAAIAWKGLQTSDSGCANYACATLHWRSTQTAEIKGPPEFLSNILRIDKPIRVSAHKPGKPRSKRRESGAGRGAVSGGDAGSARKRRRTSRGPRRAPRGPGPTAPADAGAAISGDTSDTSDTSDDNAGAECAESDNPDSADDAGAEMLHAFDVTEGDSDAEAWVDALVDALGGCESGDDEDLPDQSDLHDDSEQFGDDKDGGEDDPMDVDGLVVAVDPTDPMPAPRSFRMPPGATTHDRYDAWNDAFALSLAALRSRSRGFEAARCNSVSMAPHLKKKHGSHHVSWSDVFPESHHVDMPVAIVQLADGECRAHRFVRKSDTLDPVDVVFHLDNGLVSSGWAQPLHTDPLMRWVWPTEAFNRRRNLSGATVIHPNALIDTFSALAKSGPRSDRPYVPDTTRHLCRMWETSGTYPVALVDFRCFICTLSNYSEDMQTCACCLLTSHVFCMNYMDFNPSAEPSLLPIRFGEFNMCKLCCCAFRICSFVLVTDHLCDDRRTRFEPNSFYSC